MIAGAEAHRIRRSLESVAGWAGEIIVVINEEVCDGTDRLAASYGAKVFREPWKGYAAQKNSAADKAGNPWLLGLDADEVVSPALRGELAALLGRPASEIPHSAYRLPRCTFYFGRWIRHGDWYPDRKERLWRRGQARWVGASLHERLDTEGPVGTLKNDLLHYTAETINHQIAKTVKYADDFARHAAEAGTTITFPDLLVRPMWRFWRAYLFRLGFLDGWQGLAIAWLTAFYTFLRYLRAREAQLPKPLSP